MYRNDVVDDIGVALSRSGCDIEVDDRQVTIKSRSPVLFEAQGMSLAIYPVLYSRGFSLVGESDELRKRYPEGGTIGLMRSC